MPGAEVERLSSREDQGTRRRAGRVWERSTPLPIEGGNCAPYPDIFWIFELKRRVLMHSATDKT